MDLKKELHKAFVNSIYPHYRNYIRTFVYPRTMTERDYTKQELDALRQAVYNHEYELKNMPDLKKKIDTIRKYIAKNDNLNETPLLKRYMERTIDYPNYKQSYAPTDFGDRIPTNFNSATTDQYRRLLNNNDRSFMMQGTIGAADYDIDKQGNVTLTDRYNFTQDKITDGNHYSPLAALAKKFGKPYDIKINLGNINDWNNRYTYDNNLFDMYNDIK